MSIPTTVHSTRSSRCSADARAAYDRAITLAGNPAERAYLARRRDQLAG
ncbi:hypothetical protein [Ornithinimicrobium cryptoxanthini]|nr:hypothetical protein [Ornithinimicrobium cryptoxanthini]